MSKPGETLYVISLKHLARDGKKAAADLPEVQLSYIPARQLRTLLDAVAALAPSVTYPVEPELRITAPTGSFVVQVKCGKLHFVSWASNQKGGEFTAARIFAIVTGEAANEGARQRHRVAEPGRARNKAVLALLGAAILFVNSFTVWFVTRPPRTLLPKYTLLTPESAGRLLGNMAGVYETGSAPGDRRLQILPDGKVLLIKFGTNNSVAEQRKFTVQAAEAAGRPALITSRRSMITIKDSITVSLYGDSYQRVVPAATHSG
jgi:hypothetical protein